MRLGQPARSALRQDPLLVFSLAAAGACALAACLSGRTLLAGSAGRTPLGLDPVGRLDIGVAWSDLVQGAATTRAQALQGLLDITAVVTVGAVLVGLLTLAVLSWTRAAHRRDEVAVRRAVGAARQHLVGSALLEGTAIGLPSLGWGLAAGWLLARWLLHAWPGPSAPGDVDPLLPAAALLLTLCGGSLLVLRHAGGRRRNARAARGIGLVPQVAQMACTLAVLGAAVSLSRQAAQLLHVEPSHVDAARYQVDATALHPADRAHRFATALERLGEDPTVEAASVTSPGIGLGLGQVDWIQTDCGQCRSAGIILQWHNLPATHHVASPDTFLVLGLPLIAGRTFRHTDTWGAPRVAVVNRHLALRHFQDGKAVGRTLTLGGWRDRVSYTVIGVVDDGQPPSLGSGRQPREALYLSALQHPPSTAELLVRRAPGATAPLAVSGLALSPAPGIAALRQREASLLSWFAGTLHLQGLLALVAAMAGVFVGMRTWSESVQGELAVRRAVGAPRWRALAHVGGVVIATVAVGALAAWAFVAPLLGGIIRTVLRDAASPPGVTWAPVLLLLATALAGALPPAVAAARHPPARTLP